MGCEESREAATAYPTESQAQLEEGLRWKALAIENKNRLVSLVNVMMDAMQKHETLLKDYAALEERQKESSLLLEDTVESREILESQTEDNKALLESLQSENEELTQEINEIRKALKELSK